jgi:hypothetical protein
MDDVVTVLLILVVSSIIAGIVAVVVMSSTKKNKTAKSECGANKPPKTPPQDVARFIIVLADAFFSEYSDGKVGDDFQRLAASMSNKFTVSHISGIRALVEDRCAVLEIPRLNDFTKERIRDIIRQIRAAGQRNYGDDVVAADVPLLYVGKYRILGARKKNVEGGDEGIRERNAEKIVDALSKIDVLVEDTTTRERKFVNIGLHPEDVQDLMALENFYSTNREFFKSMFQAIESEMKRLNIKF